MTTQLDSPCSISLGKVNLLESIDTCFTSRLDGLQGKKIIFGSDEKKMVPTDGWGLKSNPYYSPTITTFQPARENAVVAAIDSSSIQLAETDDGCLFAVKCGIAIAYGGHTMMHFKIGPVLFYINDYTVRQSELDNRLANIVLFDSETAKRLIRIRVERAIQLELSSHFTDSVLLVDGSLKGSIFEEKNRDINKVAENCVLYKNSLIGISKSTKLKILDRVSAPLAKVPGPAYIEVDQIIKSLIRNTVGNNLMVKFGKTSPVLRADVVGDKDMSLGMLIGNDPIARGYPETLRLAHHISTFSGTEVTCLRSHVLNNYDVTELPAEDIRRTLLGSIPI